MNRGTSANSGDVVTGLVFVGEMFETKQNSENLQYWEQAKLDLNDSNL